MNKKCCWTKKIAWQIKYFNNNFKKILKKYLTYCPKKFKSAILYSLFPGGKRIRPMLIFASGEMCGVSIGKLLIPSISIELVHNYSLVHDDLPSMDNDDYRRGKLTVHKKFSESTAILVGDALLTLGFEIFLKNFSIKRLKEILGLFANYIGLEGLIAGQVLDIESENTKKLKSEKVKSLLKNIHINKTAKLIELCITIPGIIKNLSSKKIRVLHKIGRNYGLLFQITDDYLDSKTSQDEKKLTYPKVYGLAETKNIINKLYVHTQKLINQNFEIEKSGYMLYLLDLIVNRSN
ncbi:MAG: polyprenyl synthetase family protein [Endomicrobiia bacterium]